MFGLKLVRVSAFVFGCALFSTSALAGHAVEGRQAPFAVVVSFNSIGSGIDNRAREAFANVVKKEILERKIEKFVEKSFGREGELKSCIQFKNWADLPDARKEISDALAGSSLTELTTVLNCDEMDAQ